MDKDYSQWYKIQLEEKKKVLCMKVLSVYVISEEKQKELITHINNQNDIDKLIDIDYKLDNILNEVWDLTVKLLEWANKDILMDFEIMIQKEILDEIKEKENLDELDLSELDTNLEQALMNI